MKIRILLLLAIPALFLQACKGDYPGYSKTKSGLYYQVITDATDSIMPDSNDVVSIRLKYYDYATDSLLYNSDEMIGGPVRVIVAPQFKGDIFEGLMMMSPGDSMSFLVRTDSLVLYRMIPHTADTTGMIRFEVFLESIQTAEDFMVEQEMQRQEEERELAELEELETGDIQSYLSKNPGFSGPKGSGYYIKITKAGTGAAAKGDMHANIDFECSLINGVMVASTYTSNEPIDYVLGSKDFFVDWEEALGELKKGSEATLLFPSAMGFGRNGGGNGLIPPYAPLILKVKVNQLMSAQEMADFKTKEEARMKVIENAELDKYLKANKITAKPTASGLIYIPKVQGKGAQAMAGKTVEVHYTGKLLNGVVFDSSVDRNEPLSFTLGRGQVIEGWDEGLALMKAGGEATLIIPSHIAYGSSAAGDKIKPYSTLVFEVKLIEVK
jgi:FKBP-type peptidyl-prolyl cis-trans isomerase